MIQLVLYVLTYRRLEVGADATEARAANPGSEVLTVVELEKSLSNFVTLLISGSVVEKGIDPLEG